MEPSIQSRRATPEIRNVLSGSMSRSHSPRQSACRENEIHTLYIYIYIRGAHWKVLREIRRGERPLYKLKYMCLLGEDIGRYQRQPHWSKGQNTISYFVPARGHDNCAELRRLDYTGECLLWWRPARIPFGKGEQIRRRWAQVIGAARLKQTRTEAGIRCSYVTSLEGETDIFRILLELQQRERETSGFSIMFRIRGNQVYIAQNTLMKK